MTDEEIAKLPPYEKLLKISRKQGACRDFLARASRCKSYQEAISKEKIDLIHWFDWFKDYFTVPARAEYEKVTTPAWAEYEKVRASARAEYEKVMVPARAEYEKVMASARAEYEKVMAPALIQGAISSFG